MRFSAQAAEASRLDDHGACTLMPHFWQGSFSATYMEDGDLSVWVRSEQGDNGARDPNSLQYTSSTRARIDVLPWEASVTLHADSGGELRTWSLEGPRRNDLERAWRRALERAGLQR